MGKDRKSRYYNNYCQIKTKYFIFLHLWSVVDHSFQITLSEDSMLRVWSVADEALILE